MKVLYIEEERDTVERAAEVAGLRPSSYVATAALRMAPGVLDARDDVVQDGATEIRQVVFAWSDCEDRELLGAALLVLSRGRHGSPRLSQCLLPRFGPAGAKQHRHTAGPSGRVRQARRFPEIWSPS